jgi:hypothetical protein
MLSKTRAIAELLGNSSLMMCSSWLIKVYEW